MMCLPQMIFFPPFQNAQRLKKNYKPVLNTSMCIFRKLGNKQVDKFVFLLYFALCDSWNLNQQLRNFSFQALTTNKNAELTEMQKCNFIHICEYSLQRNTQGL